MLVETSSFGKELLPAVYLWSDFQNATDINRSPLSLFFFQTSESASEQEQRESQSSSPNRDVMWYDMESPPLLWTFWCVQWAWGWWFHVCTPLYSIKDTYILLLYCFSGKPSVAHIDFFLFFFYLCIIARRSSLLCIFSYLKPVHLHHLTSASIGHYHHHFLKNLFLKNNV